MGRRRRVYLGRRAPEARGSAAVGSANDCRRDLGAQLRATAEPALERESATESSDAVHAAAQPRSGDIRSARAELRQGQGGASHA